MPEYVAFAHRFGIICKFLWRTARIFVVKEWCGNFCSVNRWIWGLESTSAQPFPILHESGDFIISHKRIIFYCAESALFNFIKFQKIVNCQFKSFFNFQLNNCQLSIVNCQLLSACFSVSSPNLPRCYPVATPFLLRSYLEPCGLLSRCFSVTSPNLLAYIKVCIFFLPPCYNFVTVLLSPCYPVPWKLFFRFFSA